MSLKPGEFLLADDDVTLNAGRATVAVAVQNVGRHTIFISSHYPFFEANRALVFDRALAWGMRLDVPAGDCVKFPPGAVTRVGLVAYGGRRVVSGFHGLTDGAATDARRPQGVARAIDAGFGHRPANGTRVR